MRFRCDRTKGRDDPGLHRGWRSCAGHGVLRLANCQVVAHRTMDKEWLRGAAGSAQATRKVKNVTKAERGNFAIAKVEPKRTVTEVSGQRRRDDDPVGAEITAGPFRSGPVRRRDGHLDR